MPNRFTLGSDPHDVPPHRPATVAPCSPAQDRYWRLDAADPGTPSLNVSVKWRIRGHLDAGLAQEAFQAILARHAALRTSFRNVDGEPVQVIAGHVPFKLSEIDLSGLPMDDRQPEADRIGAMEARKSFDLETAPLLRATLLRLSRSEAILLVTAHHIVSDGWSMGLISKDFVNAYQALDRGLRPVLPPLPQHYPDFAEASLEALASGALRHEEDYWRTRLAGLRRVEVPPDRPRPAGRSADGASTARLLPRALTGRLAELARGEGTTFFVAVCAVLVALLHGRTGARDIAVSTQMAGRDEVEMEPVVGPFVNTLVLRMPVAPEQSFLGLCETVRDAFEEAVENHELPFGRVERMLGTDPARFPVSVNVIVQRAFIGELANDSFQLAGIPSTLPGALYDLNFIFVEREEGWRLTCEYRLDLFEEATAKALLAEYEALAQAVLDAPGDRLPPVRALPGAAGRQKAAGASARPVAGDHSATRLTWLQQGGALPALFALNHTAHNLNLYRPLSKELGGDQPFVALQLVDPLVDGEPPTTVEALAKAYCDVILATRPAGPYRLAGFCRSGVVAYEVARQLAAAGRRVDMLVLIDCWSPGYFLRQSHMARTLFRLKRAGRAAKRLWRAGPRSFFAKMAFWIQSNAAVRQAKRLMVWRHADDMADEREFWRTTDDLEAMVQRYRIPDYDGRVIIFRSETIPPGWPPDETLGWAEHLARKTACHWIPGQGHEGAFSAEGSRSMAVAIAAAGRAEEG